MSEEKSTVDKTENGVLTDRDNTGRFVQGNPGGGRPVGSRNFATIYREALSKVAQANDMSLDDVEDDLVKVAIDRARKGDFKFYQDIMDRLNGKPVQRNENLNVNAEAKLSKEEQQKLDDLIK